MFHALTIGKEVWDAKLDKIDQLQQECDELRQTITHLENGWKTDSDTLEECQIENARLRVLIHDKNEAILKAANGWELMNKYRIKLREIAAMTTEEEDNAPCAYNRRSGDTCVDCPDWENCPGWCPICGEPFETVRPGKTQPVCDCQDKEEENDGRSVGRYDDAPKEFGISQEDIDAILIPDEDALDDEWMNAPMGSPDAPHIYTVICPDCGFQKGESRDGNFVCYKCERVDGVLNAKLPGDAPPDDPMRLTGEWFLRDVKDVTDNIAAAIEKMQREFSVGRANDRYFNEKLDYIGEMKEEIQQQIDTELDAADKTYANDEETRIQIKRLQQQIHMCDTEKYDRLQQQITTLETKSDAMRLDIISPRQINPKLERLQQQIDAYQQCHLDNVENLGGDIVKMKEQINSHTRVVHGEIERRLTEMGQKITECEQWQSAHDKTHECMGLAYDRLQQQIEKLEQRINGEKGEE